LKNQKFLTYTFRVISIQTLNLHSCAILQFSAFSCFQVFCLISNNTKSSCATCFIFWLTKCPSFGPRWRKSRVHTIITFWAITIQSIAAKDGTPCILTLNFSYDCNKAGGWGNSFCNPFCYKQYPNADEPVLTNYGYLDWNRPEIYVSTFWLHLNTVSTTLHFYDYS